MSQHMKKSGKHKTQAQLQQEVDDLKDEKKIREEADKQQVAILNAWDRLDPDGTRY